MSWIAPVAGAVLGGIAGGQKKRSSSTVDVAPASALENQAVSLSGDQLKQLQDLIAAGPGKSDITAAGDAGNNLTALLSRLQQSGGIATGAELDQSRQQSEALFAPERVAMQQAFQDQQIQANRTAARMGRSINDPILQAKLAQEQTRQTQQLNAQHTAYAAQAPQRQLDMAGQLFNVRQGLASQALANRQNLFAMGQQAISSERNFRLGTAGRSETSGGGLAGAISGALAGAGTGASVGNSLSSMFSAAPTSPVATGMPDGGYVSSARGGGRQGFFDAPMQPAKVSFSQAPSAGGGSSWGTDPIRNSLDSTYASELYRGRGF